MSVIFQANMAATFRSGSCPSKTLLTNLLLSKSSITFYSTNALDTTFLRCPPYAGPPAALL